MAYDLAEEQRLLQQLLRFLQVRLLDSSACIRRSNSTFFDGAALLRGGAGSDFIFLKVGFFEWAGFFSFLEHACFLDDAKDCTFSFLVLANLYLQHTV